MNHYSLDSTEFNIKNKITILSTYNLKNSLNLEKHISKWFVCQICWNIDRDSSRIAILLAYIF